LNLEVGTVFRWDNFPAHRFGGESKARWFICLGFSGIFAQVAIVYLSTTTTQLQHFGTSGTRRNHSHFIFKTNQHPIFEEDCAIDFDERPYPVNEAKFKSSQKDIIIKGQLNEDTMRMIYKQFLRSKPLSVMELIDIHNSWIFRLNRPLVPEDFGHRFQSKSAT